MYLLFEILTIFFFVSFCVSLFWDHISFLVWNRIQEACMLSIFTVHVMKYQGNDMKRDEIILFFFFFFAFLNMMAAYGTIIQFNFHIVSFIVRI